MIGGTLAYACGEDRFRYYPAIVVDEVWVSVLEGGQYRLHPSKWPGIVDTGAARSAIPSDVCRDLRIPKPKPWDYLPVQTFDRRPDPPKKPHYYAKLHIAGMKEVKLRVAGAARSSVILGRDFLAELGLILVMDSASGKWSLGRLGPQGILGKWAARLLKLD